MKHAFLFVCTLLLSTGLAAQLRQLEDRELLALFLDANSYDRKLPKAELRDYDSTHVLYSSLLTGDFFDGEVSYQLKILQVSSDFECNYKMLFYTDNTLHQDIIAIRLGGYLENDFVHFYERVLCHYLSKKKATTFLTNLQLQDSTLTNIDFTGLVKAARSSNREMECMKAMEYVYPSAGTVYVHASANWEQIRKEQLHDQVYAYFSNRPFSGELPPKRKYRRRH